MSASRMSKLSLKQSPKESQDVAATYIIRVKPGQRVYRYDVEIKRNFVSKDGNKSKVLTKKGMDDGESSWRRHFCMDTVRIFQQKTNNFGLGDKGKYVVYDGRKNLYVAAPIKVDAGKKTITLFEKDYENEDDKRSIGDGSVFIEISQSVAHELDISDVCSSQTEDVDTPISRRITTFFDVLTSMGALYTGTHTSPGSGNLFEVGRDSNTIHSAIVLRAGLAKGCQVIDNNGSPTYALIVDAKKTAFFKESILQPIYIDVVDVQRQSQAVLGRLLQGVRAQLTYAQHRTIVIEGFSKQLAGEIKLENEPISKYFFDKYQIRIDTRVPMVVTDRGQYFPMDFVRICPDQRVPNDKLPEAVRTEVLRATAVLPNLRRETINQSVINARIMNSDFLPVFGVTIAPTMLPVQMRTCEHPRVTMMNLNKGINQGAWKIENSKVCVPPTVKKWMILKNKGVTFNADRFLESLRLKLLEMGVGLPQPIKGYVNLHNADEVRKSFSEWKAAQVTFVLVLDEKANNTTHSLLKLIERESGILTQHVCVETIKNNGSKVVENIALKLCSKNAGVIVAPRINDSPVAKDLDLVYGKVLVVGIDISLPGKPSPMELKKINENQVMKDLHVSSCKPAIVGITGNYGQHPTNIIGDYYFQNAMHEVLDKELLRKRFRFILKSYFTVRREPPKHVVVLRDGVSEGQLSKSSKFEVPIILEELREASRNRPLPGLTYIVVTKQHNKRFFSHEPKGVCEPGCVVDATVVRPDVPEFFLQAHKPIKGTGKFAQFSVVYNQPKKSLAALEAFGHMLCYDHQIVTSATSLPEPIYYAKEMIKRGRNNLEEKYSGQPLPMLANGLPDIASITETLSYVDVNTDTQRDVSKLRFAA